MQNEEHKSVPGVFFRLLNHRTVGGERCDLGHRPNIDKAVLNLPGFDAVERSMPLLEGVELKRPQCNKSERDARQ